MASDVVMPRLSDSMEEGTVLKWLVEQGGEVKRGEPLVEIETDKANMVHNADADGVLLEVVADEGDTLEVGAVIARVGEPGEQQTSDDRPQTSEAEPEPEPEPAQEEPEPEPEERPSAPDTSGNGGERVKASPVARRVAGELGVELAQLEGSGPGGRIVKADVEKAADSRQSTVDSRQEEPRPQPAAEPASAGAKGTPEVLELSRLQRTVSRRMAEAKATAPDFSLELDVDMTLCIELRERLKQQTDPAPSYNDMVVKAAALALRDHPKVNGAYRDGSFELYSRVNVGVAVAAQDALVVPTVLDADRKSLGQISADVRALAEKVRAGTVTPPELSGGTFTVSNLGMYGMKRITPVINPPQAAILGVGEMAPRAVVRDGRIVVRTMMDLTLVCDHRILYGADAAQFLARIRALLEAPLRLAL